MPNIVFFHMESGLTLWKMVWKIPHFFLKPPLTIYDICISTNPTYDGQGPTYSKCQIKRNNGSGQANYATKVILIPKWVISIPISIMFMNFTILTF